MSSVGSRGSRPQFSAAGEPRELCPCQPCPFPAGPGVQKHREGRSETHLKRSLGPSACLKASSALRNEGFLQPVVENIQ